MKEIQEINKDILEVSAEAPIKNETKFIGSVSPKKGHTCFELNLDNGEISIAKFESYAFSFDKKRVVAKKKVIVKQRHIYTMALNKKNAIKHFAKVAPNLFQ